MTESQSRTKHKTDHEQITKYHEVGTATETHAQAKRNEQYWWGGGVESAAALGRVRICT